MCKIFCRFWRARAALSVTALFLASCSQGTLHLGGEAGDDAGVSDSVVDSFVGGDARSDNADSSNNTADAYNPEQWIFREGFSIRRDHPRLFISADNLASIRQRASTTHADTYAALLAWGEENWGDLDAQVGYWTDGHSYYDHAETRYALIYLLGEISGHNYAHPIEEYGREAIKIILAIAKGDISPGYREKFVAITYDWVNDLLERSEKEAIVDWFRERCGTTPTLPERPTGYRFAGTPRSFYPGLAFFADGVDDQLAETYVDFIPAHFDDMRAICHSAGEDGGYTGGFSYARTRYGGGGWIDHVGMDLTALKTATNLADSETFEKYTFQNGFPDWVLYGIMPGPISPSIYTSTDLVTVTKFEDINLQAWNIESDEYGFLQSLMWSKQRALDTGDSTKAGVIQWLLEDRLETTHVDSTWDLLFNDRTVSPLSPELAGLPTSRAFGWREAEGRIDSYLDNPKAGLGQVFMRSSWDSTAATTYATFKAMPYVYFGHQHFDSLTFSIYKTAPLVVPNAGMYFYWYEGTYIDYSGGTVGYPHYWYYFQRSPATNSPLIMDPDEEIVIATSSSAPTFKDGGQRGIRYAGGTWGSILEGSVRDWGGLVRHEDNATYTYSSADATKGYNSSVDGRTYLTAGASPKVSLVRRDFVYLKGAEEYFVVFDRIESTDPSFRKVFQLHTSREPLFNGTTETLYGAEPNGIFRSTDTDSMVLEHDAAKLFIKTLLPQVSTVTKTGGQGVATLNQALDDQLGTTPQGEKIDIAVSTTEPFSNKPVVVIQGTLPSDGSARPEAFMCDGKSATHLTGCIRGLRYYKANQALNHAVGDEVVQYFAWMAKQADTGDWISYPIFYGTPYEHFGAFPQVVDIDDYGRWTLHVETTQDETLSNFLHVLHPTTDMSESALVATELVAGTGGLMVGALVKSASPWILLFSKTAQLQNEVSYTANYTGSGRHLILDIASGRYDIRKNDERITTIDASNQGTLYFETTGGGRFSIEKQ